MRIRGVVVGGYLCINGRRVRSGVGVVGNYLCINSRWVRVSSGVVIIDGGGCGAGLLGKFDKVDKKLSYTSV